MRFMGRCWRLGDNISTDHIISGKYKYSVMTDLSSMLPHLFEEVLPGFYKYVRPGDIIVAGRNFGMGSSREHAARLIKMAGISAIIAKSFARIFFRNAINVGLPVIQLTTIPEVSEDGDVIDVDLINSVVVNVNKNVREYFTYPRELIRILSEGGVINYIKKYGDLP